MQYEFHELHPELGDHYALPRDSTEVKQQLASYDWPNRKRQYDLCHKYNPKYETAGKFPIQDQYSVAISYYNPERMQYLPKLIQHYLASERYVQQNPPEALSADADQEPEDTGSTPSSSRGTRPKRTSRQS